MDAPLSTKRFVVFKKVTKHLKDTLEKSEKVTTREINNRRVSATPIKGFREASNSSFFNLIDYYLFILN